MPRHATPASFLVFDEADSLLADRRLAERSWEVSQVNEMLTWMENHPLPFACTTNFGRHLDPATLRRFVFKVTLDYLAPTQIAAAFRSYFGLIPPAGLTDIAALTPGRLRGGAPQGRDPRPPAGTGGDRRHAARGMRRQAGSAAGDRLSPVKAPAAREVA